MKNPIATIETPEGYVVDMTPEQWKTLIGGELADQRGNLTAHGVWQQPIRWQAPAIKRNWQNKGYGNTVVSVAFYGRRSLYRLREDGYGLRGTLKACGQEVRGYTSDIMVRVNDKLFSVSVISITS